MKLRLTDRYELRTFDNMNLQLWELREIDPTKPGRFGDGGKRAEWRPCGNYFPDVPSAVRFVFAKLQRDDPYEGDLEGALARLEAIAAGLKAYVAAMEVE